MDNRPDAPGGEVMSKTIFRIHKEDGSFFIMPKAIVNDDQLSYRAKGIMAYLLSKPDDWTVYFADIVKRSTEGKAAVRTAIKELEEAGYISKQWCRDEDTGKMLGWEWHVYETPKSEKPKVENPDFGFPKDGKPDTTNNKDTKNKETNNKQTLAQVWEKYVGTLLTSTQAQFLYDLPMDWDAHTSTLPDTHPDRRRAGREVVEEAIKITGLQEVRKISYTTAIVDRWMKDGYKVDTRKNGKREDVNMKVAPGGGVYGG